MKLKIVTPEKMLLDDEVSSVTLPGSEGEMTVLPKHAALAATLKKGTLRYRAANTKEPQLLAIGGGCVEVYRDKVLVVTLPPVSPAKRACSPETGGRVTRAPKS